MHLNASVTFLLHIHTENCIMNPLTITMELAFGENILLSFLQCEHVYNLYVLDVHGVSNTTEKTLYPKLYTSSIIEYVCMGSIPQNSTLRNIRGDTISRLCVFEMYKWSSSELDKIVERLQISFFSTSL